MTATTVVPQLDRNVNPYENAPTRDLLLHLTAARGLKAKEEVRLEAAIRTGNSIGMVEHRARIDAYLNAVQWIEETLIKRKVAIP